MDQFIFCYFCREQIHNGVAKTRLEVYDPDQRRTKCLKVFYAHKSCWTEADGYAVEVPETEDMALAAAGYDNYGSLSGE